MYLRHTGKRTFFNRKRYAGVALGQGEADEPTRLFRDPFLRLRATHPRDVRRVPAAQQPQLEALSPAILLQQVLLAHANGAQLSSAWLQQAAALVGAPPREALNPGPREQMKIGL